MRKRAWVLFVGLVTAILGLSTSVALLAAPVEGHVAILISISLIGISPVVLVFFAIIDYIERNDSVTNFYLGIMQDTDTAVDDFEAMQALQRDDEKAVYIRGDRAVSREEFYAKELPKPRPAKPSQTVRKV